MRIIRGLHNLRDTDRGVVVSLGNYDGVHRGHQALFEMLQSEQPGLRRCAVCFEPQPLELLRPDEAPPRLQTLAEKLRCFRDIGLEQVLVLRFNHRLAQTSPEDFVQSVLIDGLAAKLVVVGDDYRFGCRREGDVKLLKAMAVQGGYELRQLGTVIHDEERISSTRIRDALAKGDMQDATRCLGRPYRLRGRVIHGQKLGRKIGAPTANVALRGASPLRHGVYCVRLNGDPAVANIGMRPTIEGGAGEHLEVHLLEGRHELYDQMVNVDFEVFLRPEIKFADLQALQNAIRQDVSKAQEFYGLGRA